MLPWILCAVLYVLGMVLFIMWATDDFDGYSDITRLTIASIAWPIVVPGMFIVAVFMFLKRNFT